MVNLLVIPSKIFAAGLRPAVGALSVHFAGPIAERNPNLHTPVDVKGDHEQALQICSVKMRPLAVKIDQIEA